MLIERGRWWKRTALAVLAAAVPSLGLARAYAAEWLAPPTVPPAIAVPAAAKLTAHFHAVGDQIYVCSALTAPAPTAARDAAGGPDAAVAAAAFVWTLTKPEAKLFDEKGAPVGTHAAGPIWTATDGSSVAGKKIAQADAPTAAAIPWLLVHAEKTTGSGVLAKVSYVQRVATVKGKPASAGCDAHAAGKELHAPYTAEYYFYTGG